MDPIIANYKLVLDLDVACAFGYSLEEIQAMYRNNSGVPIDPNSFKSSYPAAHYSIYLMKLDIFGFLLKNCADIDTLRDREQQHMERYRSGHVGRAELLQIYQIVKKEVGADLVSKFERLVLLRDIYDKLKGGKDGEMVVLTKEDGEESHRAVDDIISAFGLKIDMDIACSLCYTIEEVKVVCKRYKIGGNANYSGFSAAQIAIR